jgi:hypothetical protein
MEDFSRYTQSEFAESTTAGESPTDKLARSALLMCAGFGGIGKAAENAVCTNPGETAIKLGLSIGVGLGISRFAPSRGFTGLLCKTGLGVATLSFGAEALKHGQQVWSAMDDNLKSAANWDRNVKIMETSVGNFAFDTALMTLGGMAGGAAGNRYRYGRMFGGPHGSAEKLINPSANAAERSAGKLSTERAEPGLFVRPGEPKLVVNPVEPIPLKTMVKPLGESSISSPGRELAAIVRPEIHVRPVEASVPKELVDKNLIQLLAATEAAGAGLGPAQEQALTRLAEIAATNPHAMRAASSAVRTGTGRNAFDEAVKGAHAYIKGQPGNEYTDFLRISKAKIDR